VGGSASQGMQPLRSFAGGAAFEWAQTLTGCRRPCVATGVISLWCAWAAVTSIVIVIHLRTAENRDESVAALIRP